MREQTIKLYTFNELDSDIQDKVIEKLYDINVNYNWWDFILDDATNIGLKIDSFNTNKLEIDGEFIHDALYCANRILSEHGEQCETYKTAWQYLDEIKPVIAAKDELTDDYDALTREQLDQLDELDEKINELDDEFLKSLCEDYRIILNREAEHLTSRESIIDTINANEYEFTENGDIWR